jgi:hypothetical protein
MCSCTRFHACRSHGGADPKPPETTLEAAERRYKDALNRGADPVVVVDAGATLIHELMVALHGSVRAA